MWYMHMPFNIRRYEKRNAKNEARIRQKDEITVVFFASNLSQWHYQGLYEEMIKYPRFKVSIVLSPFANNPIERRIADVETLRIFFNKKSINYVDYDTECMKGADVHAMTPDIIFYSQPYYTVMEKGHRYYEFKDSLLAYYPYFYRLTNLEFEYNEDFQNRAWRLYYETEYQKRDAANLAAIGDKNVIVTGYPNADEFAKEPADVWKPQEKQKKRIIWAPHFTINNDGWYQNSSFIWMADYMLELTEKYKDDIQFAFKPHPKLISELYKHPLWGKEKADAYFEEWVKRNNCQLETGVFVDLFMTSDAMIHDSGSFTVEYMYSSNPVMYMCGDMESLLKTTSEFGRIMYDLHYIGKNKEDIKHFVESIVLNREDPLKAEREMIKNKYLLPPNNRTCAENTIMDIIETLTK